MGDGGEARVEGDLPGYVGREIRLWSLERGEINETKHRNIPILPVGVERRKNGQRHEVEETC